MIGMSSNLQNYLEAVYRHEIVRSLDPADLMDPPWCRIETLDRSELEDLKKDIQATGRNEIPVLVHTRSDGRLEVIYGARRVQACRELGMPVFALCIEREIVATEVFRLQEVENRSRSAVSAYENAKRYDKALSDGLFATQRKLAEYIGKSQPWVSAVLPLAALPLEIVRAFDRLNDLQPAHATELQPILKKDRNGVIARANDFAQLRDPKKARSGKETMRHLLGKSPTSADEWQPLNHCGHTVGHWKCSSDGETTVRIPRELDFDEFAAIAQVAGAVKG